MKILYTAVATATGGRNGHVISNDQVLDLQVRTPKELGGSGGANTNPEQLFAAGYAACFDSALNLVAAKQKISLTSTSITAKVSIGPNDKGGYGLAVELQAKIEGTDRSTALLLLETAHQVCPYSNAIRNNVEVNLKLID